MFPANKKRDSAAHRSMVNLVFTNLKRNLKFFSGSIELVKSLKYYAKAQIDSDYAVHIKASKAV